MAAGVTVEPPPGFEVSTSSDFSLNVGDGSNPLVVGAAGTVNSTAVYVRLKANATAGSYSGNITLNSSGANPVNVATVASTVSKATPSITAAPTATAITFGQSLASSTVNNDGTASVAGSFAFTSTSATPTGAGSYSAGVTFTPTDTDNYNTATTTTTVTVNKATPTVATAPTATLSYGQMLSSAVISGGSATGVGGASVLGSYSFNSPATTPSAIGTSSYAATFTPSGADANNYNTASTSISVTVGAASVDGSTVTQNFNSATPTAETRVTSFPGWSSNNSQGADGFVTVNDDPDNVAAYIGAFISDVPNPELVYQFNRGGSEKIVFIWEQQITESSVDFPGVDSFGWAFRNGSTTLFSLRFLPEQVVANDPAWIDWDENGSRAAPNQLVAVAFDGNGLPSGGPGLGPLDQVNFSTFDRGQTVKFRVIIDLEAKTWSADVDQAGSWFGLVFASALPAGTTNVDRMVALWDMQDKTVTAGLYQSAGDNLMLFDNLAITGSDLGRTPVTLSLTAPTAPVIYDGLAKAATASATPSVATRVDYWNTALGDSQTNAPVNAGQYTAKVTVVDDTAYAATPVYVTYTVAPKAVTVSNVSANNKEYDGNTSATLNTLGADIVGRVGIDDVNLAGTASGVFTDKNVGTNIPVTVTGFTLTGTAAGNYSLTQPIPDADITAKEVTVLGAVANSKTYDRTNTATINLTGATLNGVISPDVVTVSGGGTFVSSDAGPIIPVTANLSLGGANAGNYTLSQPTYLAADIDARALTIPDAQAQDKVYDGSTDAVITGTLTGVLAGDTVTLAGAGQFASSGAGTGIAVTSYLFLEGGSAGNYTLTAPTGLTANIDPQLISVTLNPPASFTYDGSSKDYFVNSSGVIADVTYQSQDGTTYGPTFVAPVNAGDYTVTATLSGNYSGSATENFTITKAALTITADPQTKTFGDLDPAIFSYSIGGSGLLGAGDMLTGSLIRDPGDTVGTYAIKKGTLDAGPNYDVTFNGDDLTITKATPTIVIAPSASAITEGQALSASNLTGGSATGVAGALDGTFAFTSPSTVPVVGTASQSVTFTPTDTTNYNNATTSVSVTVNSSVTPYDTWIASYGYTIGTSPALRSDDPDGDGMNNLTEFAFGTDPTFNTASPIEVSQFSATQVRVTFLQRNDNSVTYDPKKTTDLAQLFANWTSFTPTASLDQSGLPRPNYTRVQVLLDSASNDRTFVKVNAAEVQ